MKSIFVHPHLGSITVYRSRALRRISISVSTTGKIRLNVPVRYSLKSALAFLDQKESWVQTTLKRVAVRYADTQILRPHFTTYSHRLEFGSVGLGARIGYDITDDVVRIFVPEGMNYQMPEVQSVARKAVTETLRKEAADILPPLTRTLALQYGFNVRHVSVRASRTRWGSCSVNNDISLSIYLMLLPEHLIRHVILHELCHTRFKDHSTAFHSLLDSLSDGHEQLLRRELRSYNFSWLCEG